MKLRKTERKLTNKTLEHKDLQENEAANFSQNTQITCIFKTRVVCMCVYTNIFNVYVCVYMYICIMKENSKSWTK